MIDMSTSQTYIKHNFCLDGELAVLCLPNIMSVVLFRESMIDSLHEYRLSYFVFIMLSLTFIAGAANFPL